MICKASGMCFLLSINAKIEIAHWMMYHFQNQQFGFCWYERYCLPHLLVLSRMTHQTSWMPSLEAQSIRLMQSSCDQISKVTVLCRLVITRQAWYQSMKLICTIIVTMQAHIHLQRSTVFKKIVKMTALEPLDMRWASSIKKLTCSGIPLLNTPKNPTFLGTRMYMVTGWRGLWGRCMQNQRSSASASVLRMADLAVLSLTEKSRSN